MCGGLKDSQKYWRAKNAQIEAEMKRLANLKQGWTYMWPIIGGAEEVRFGGHARIENITSVWSGKIERHVKISASEFQERDTVSGSRELRPFPVPDGKCIHGIITKQHEMRIVTQAADENVSKVHHRMPHLIEE